MATSDFIPKFNFSYEVGLFELIILEFMIFLLILFLVMLYIYMKYVRNNIGVTILEETSGGGNVIINDRAQFKQTPEGKIYLKMWKHKKIPLPAVESNDFTFARGFFLRKGIIFKKINEITYIPQNINMDHNSPFFTPEKYLDLNKWNSALLEQIMIKIKHKKDNVLLQVLPWFAIVFIVIILGLAMKYMTDKQAEASVNFGKQINQASQTLNEATDKVIPYLAIIAGAPSPNSRPPP